MRLDGFGLFVDDMAKMVCFYKDVLEFEIKEEENTSNVYLVKDGISKQSCRQESLVQIYDEKYEELTMKIQKTGESIRILQDNVSNQKDVSKRMASLK